MFPQSRAIKLDTVDVVDLQFDYKIHRAPTNGSVPISFLLSYFPQGDL